MIRDVKGIETEFKTMEELVEFVMEESVDSRSNDVVLYVMCCITLGAEDMYDIIDLNLNMMTCHRVRRIIQNEQNRLLPSESVQNKRKKREKDIEYYLTHE